MLVLVLLMNLLIAADDTSSVFYSWFLYVQLFFYVLALIGWLQLLSGRSIGIVAVPFYFLFMNYCLVRGFIRFLRKDQSVLWEKSLREVAR
jgi:hypothetical protein